MRRVRRTACVEIKPAAPADAAKLTEVQARAFADDNKRKPPGCSMEGPPGFDSLAWNLESIERTPYYKGPSRW